MDDVTRPDLRPERKVQVWDMPTRLFHWSLVLLVALSYASARMGKIDWHFLSGYAVLTLVLFRIAWGIAGSDTSRFSRFVRRPADALRHLRDLPRRQAGAEPGHNPAGAFMVLALLGLLLAQTVTGLFSSDGLIVEGPLAHLVDGATSEAATSWHGFFFDVIVVAVGLHVAAVLAYAVVAREDLVRPMILGWKRLPPSVPAPRMASPLLAAALLAASAAAVWAISRLG
ncbi:cytochrome b/b6 domain-containing protein [Xanthobacter pseudotagetidis]|uniref:cytochrome b/b6 domain-containing protein n=1 Tax=Xanthobacter pseudotagetidis TaxID=3119911 RepID=UPI00372717DA